MRLKVRFTSDVFLPRAGKASFPSLHTLAGNLLFLFLTMNAGDPSQAQTKKPAVEPFQCKECLVVGITGRWYQLDSNSEKSTELHFGQAITASCVVGHEAGSSLAVTFSGHPFAFKCDGKPEPPCRQPILEKCAIHVVPPPDKSFVVSLVTAIGAVFSDPERYITPVSRGLEPHLSDSVLLLSDGKIDLAPALQDMNPGKYELQMESLSADKKPQERFQAVWTGTGPALQAGSGIAPGLYRLAQLNAQSESVEPAAWVLVEGRDRFTSDSSGLRATEDEIQSWPDEVDPRTPPAVRRAYLESLGKKVR